MGEKWAVRLNLVLRAWIVKLCSKLLFLFWEGRRGKHFCFPNAMAVSQCVLLNVRWILLPTSYIRGNWGSRKCSKCLRSRVIGMAAGTNIYEDMSHTDPSWAPESSQSHSGTELTDQCHCGVQVRAPRSPAWLLDLGNGNMGEGMSLSPT